MKKICLLGASGSIGGQTLDIISQDDNFSLVAISCGKNITKLKEIIHLFPSIGFACVSLYQDYLKLQKEYPTIKFFYGDDGLNTLIEASQCDMVVNALVGFVGFIPSVTTLKNNKILALANKETLVVGGEIINDLLASNHGKLYPIDSEHVALSKCLENKDIKDVKRLILTASGGSFRDLTREQLKNVTLEDALKHPTWSMGKKITIDSATMMNKGFEIIEAKYLFNLPSEKIDVLIHDQSLIHSLVEFNDHSFLADLGPSDMRIPIAYALNEGKRKTYQVNNLDLEKISSLNFRKFDDKRYPLVSLARYCLSQGGTLPCVLNASNEIAVNAFLNHQISFLDIEEIVKIVTLSHHVINHPQIEDLVNADTLARKLTKEVIERRNYQCK